MASHGIAGLDRIAQVKLPVTDLARSVGWYRELLGLRLFAEFAEDGVVRGAGLIDPRERFCIALRDRTVCAGTILDVPDPDGTVLRFYHFTAGTAGFTGVESRDGAIVGSYPAPRLPAA